MKPRSPSIGAVAISTACIVAALASPVRAQGPQQPEQQKASAPQGVATATKVVPPKYGISFFGNLKAREEYIGWFPSDKAEGNYAFFGTMLRVGVTQQTHRDETTLELAIPFLSGMPKDAQAPSPQGTSGWGATYNASNGDQMANLFVKQGYVRYKNVGSPDGSLKLGRFEFADGLEVTPKDPTLAYLNQNRIAQRLLGTAYVTFMGRSFDGLQFVNDTPQRNITALAAFPTRGAYDIKGSDTLTDIQVGYLAATYPHTNKRDASESRLFAVYYGDERPGTTKADSRPASVREADHASIFLTTFGGDYVRTWQAGSGRMDALLWGAGQLGQWGALRQGAYAYSAEIGYQPNGVAFKPWFRAGYSFDSGDGNSSDGQHGTFIPLLPTSRIYARFPFFTTANLKDLFAMAILRPTSRVTVRTDIHSLSLADSHDLWYSGTGAFENANFGYSGRPSGGHTGLATLLDIGTDFQVQKQTLVSFYFSYAIGGPVIAHVYNGRDGEWAFAQISRNF